MNVSTILEIGEYSGQIDTLSEEISVKARITEIGYRNGERVYHWELMHSDGRQIGAYRSSNPSNYTFPKIPVRARC